MEALVVYITAPDEENAAKMAKVLIGEKLAGCVNIVKGLRSIYAWQGKIEDEPEVLMIVKTRIKKFQALQDRVKELHPYTVPEIIALPVVEGSEEYIQWLREATT